MDLSDCKFCEGDTNEYCDGCDCPCCSDCLEDGLCPDCKQDDDDEEDDDYKDDLLEDEEE